MSHRITIQPISTNAFAPYGDVIEATGAPDKMINQGKCERFHDLAKLDFGTGQAGVSLFHSALATLPLHLEMVERHPEGSQTFIPMSADPFLVVVADDEDGIPNAPQAFLTTAGQAISFHRNTWHGVLTPLSGTGLFAVVDRIGDGANLEEHWFKKNYTIDR